MSGGDHSLELVGTLSEGLLDTPSFARAAEHLRRDPACAALIDERWIPGEQNLEELAALPEGSLGHAYAREMNRLGYDPNLHAGMVPESDAIYVELRLSQTHDLWHVITGFDTSALGEIGLQAFHLASSPTRWPRCSRPMRCSPPRSSRPTSCRRWCRRSTPGWTWVAGPGPCSPSAGRKAGKSP